jgi:hypothetical protein
MEKSLVDSMRCECVFRKEHYEKVIDLCSHYCEAFDLIGSQHKSFESVNDAAGNWYMLSFSYSESFVKSLLNMGIKVTLNHQES